jgi:uncharacterized protein involved in outer membrane biogenesis
MRRLAIIAAILIGAVAAIAAAVLLLVDVNQFRGTIQSQLQQRLGRPVTLGSMGLKLIPLSIRANDVTIGNPPGFPLQPPFVAAKELTIRVSLGPLLRKRVQVDSIRLSSPSIELVKANNGQWNTAGLGSGSGGQRSNTILTLSDLEIEDGRVTITDLTAHEPKTVYEHIEARLQDLAVGRPFHVTVRLRAPQGDIAADVAGIWNESGVLRLTTLTASIGGVKATGHGEIRTAENQAAIDAELRTDNAPIADLLRLAGSDITGSGLLTLTLQIHGPADATAYSGSGSLRDVKINLPSLRKPLEVQSANIQLTPDRATLENITGKLASTTVRGGLAVTHFVQPRIEFHADADRLDLAELEQLSANAPAKTSKKSGGSPSLSASGTLGVGTLTYGQLALTDVKANCRFENGVLRLDPVSANTFGGATEGAITVDTRPDAGAYAVQVALKSVDANKLLSATSSLKQRLFGVLSGNADVQLRPKPGQDFARALNGVVKVQLTNGRLAGVQLLNEAASLARAVGYTKRNEAFTNILKLAGTMRIQDGVANTDDMQLAFDGGSMSATGTAGLADQTLNLHVTTVLPKAISEQIGGSKAGGWMSTVLANSKGELIIPAIVTGTFSQPRFAPDAERIAKLKLASFLPSHDNPQGIATGVKSIVDAFKKKPGAAGADGQKQGNQAEPLLNLLDGLRKKPREQH